MAAAFQTISGDDVGQLVYSHHLMRFVLAFLAVLALLSSPVTAAAAQVACSHDGPMAMAGMDMTAMPGMHQAGSQKTGDPCCDQTGQHGGKSDMSCAQACAAMCGVTAALASSSYGVVFLPVRAEIPPARIVSSHPYQPAGLKRPPKSIV
jgi:uncharacterized protein involved in copper resistance